ncbi:MAG: ABC transporter ATP-binding protein [Clostridia bacterium]
MLSVKNLIKRYPNNNFNSADDISFEVGAGEIFGFLGKNGAGKSTVIKCITGIIPFDSGTVTICGADILKSPIAAKRNMGYVPDNHMVIEKLTGREYVNYVADLYRVSLADRVERLRYFLQVFSLEHAVDKQIKSYSHGMKQKICIIAALIHEPKVWILDEPMMGLDPQSTADIINYMQEHSRKGNTVFFSSHNLDIVKQLCHRTAIVDKGKITEILELAGNPTNQNRLEEVFFKATGGTQGRLITPTEPLKKSGEGVKDE